MTWIFFFLSFFYGFEGPMGWISPWKRSTNVGESFFGSLFLQASFSTQIQRWSSTKNGFTGWWFQIFFIFTPIWGRFPFWRAYFSAGLKPPTSSSTIWDRTDVPPSMNRSGQICPVWIRVFHTWRITPVSKWLVTPMYKPFRPFVRGTAPVRGLTNHGYWPLTKWDDPPSMGVSKNSDTPKWMIYNGTSY